jgi:hypothetical protein
MWVISGLTNVWRRDLLIKKLVLTNLLPMFESCTTRKGRRQTMPQQKTTTELISIGKGESSSLLAHPHPVQSAIERKILRAA